MYSILYAISTFETEQLMPTKTTAKTPPTARRITARRSKPAASTHPGASGNRHRPPSDKSPHGVTPGGAASALDSPGARGRRPSVNVFECDLVALEPLRAYLRAETGLRVIRDSALVQVACRVFVPGPAAVAALRAVMAADGRHA